MSEQKLEPGTSYSTLFARLMAPFLPEQVDSRVQSGETLQYIDAATAANRLDDVLGPEHWEFEVKPWGQDALIGTLKLTLPDGRLVAKSSVGAKPDMKTGGPDDPYKAADSDCFKRCCDRFGIGRYLRQSGLPQFVMDELQMTSQALAMVSGASRPAQFRTQQDSRPAQPSQSQNGHTPPQNGGRQFDNTRCPAHGRGLFAWAKEKEKDGTKNVVNDLNRIGHDLGFPDRMVDWTADDVKGAWDAYHGVE